MDRSHKSENAHATIHRPKNLSNKEGLREDACISLRRENKTDSGGEWREGTVLERMWDGNISNQLW